MLAAFGEHRVVGLMSPVVDRFVYDLVADRRFAERVDDIVIECGNSRHQRLLDRYVAGADVMLAEVRRVWRDTTQSDCGFSSFYETLVPLVRRVNEGLPRVQRIRVLAADPPVDWDRIRRPEDLERFHDRDGPAARLMKTEVLEKGRRALLLYGLRHLVHGDKGSLVSQYEVEYPGVTYVVAYHRRFECGNDRLEARMAGWPLRSLVPLEGSWLGRLDATCFPDTEDAEPGAKGYPGVDAYLYLGRRDVLLREKPALSAALDEAYLAEMERRADLRGIPAGSPMRPRAQLRREAEAGVLLYEPATARRDLR
ncbi:hypothetical protein P8605_05265 [Streptomyces sp. T-3]|nr:hypothetical protein [Streptomyces sp. T-3]